MSERWQRVKFGDVVRNVRETEHNPLEMGLERYVGLGDLEPEDLHIRSWGMIADGTSFTRVFREGQVLFARRRAYQRKVAVAEWDGLCSGDMMVFEPKLDEEGNVRLLPELLPFITQSERFFQYVLDMSQGSLSPRVKWKDLAQYEFALPPLAEQRQIAEILWTADEAIEDLDNAIRELDKSVRVMRANAFGKEGTKLFRLSDLCGSEGIKIGPFGSQLHAEEYVTNGVPVVMPTDMVNGEINTESVAMVTAKKASELSIHKVRAGDILLPRRGELDRRAFVNEDQEGWLCGTGSIRIRTRKDVHNRAIFHALAAPQTVSWLQRNAVGTTMPNLNTRIVSDIPIRLPSGDSLGLLVHSLGELIQNQKQAIRHLEKQEQLKKGLLTHFLGE